MPPRDIALNFLPLETREFPFSLFRRRYEEGDRREPFRPARLRKLPPEHAGQDYADYWVSPVSFPGSEQFETTSTVNHLVTLDVLHHALHRRLLDIVGKANVIQEKGIFGRTAIVLASHREGQETIWMRPHFLHKTRELGFLLDYWLRVPDPSRTSRRLLQLSLTLDAHGRRNRNFYLDRYQKIGSFLDDTFSKIFPLTITRTQIHVARRLRHLPPFRLSPNRLVFGRNISPTGAFAGVKNLGPYHLPAVPPHIYFLYRPGDRSLSRNLFRALRGDSFPTFSGMTSMFGTPFDRTTVSGITIEDYSPSAIANALASSRP